MNSPQLLTTPHSLDDEGACRPRSPLSPWRSWLLGTVTAGMMFLSYGRYVRAQEMPPFAVDSTPCSSPDGTNVTCTGDVSGGIAIDNGTNYSYTTLTVEGVTANIAAGTNRGIYFYSDTGGNVTIDSDTGEFDLTTTGGFAPGIQAISYASGGDAGAVTVMHSGYIRTEGNRADGIYARSFTYTGNAGMVTVTHTGDIRTVDIGADGIVARSYADNGDTGTVTVTHTGDITTESIFADGIYARSQSNDGNTRAVMVTQTGNITTEGNNTYGIRATSYTNGIGAYAGAITVTVTGNITTTDGVDSDGIFVESSALNGTAGPITVTLNGGTIDSSRAGVRFVDGATNRLIINNDVTVSGITNDIVGATGHETIYNYGTLTSTGDIDLGDGMNTFINHGVFNSGRSVNLVNDPMVQGGNQFTNHGILSPGGNEDIQTTVLTGDFVQSSSGALAMNVDPAASIDPADLIQMAVPGDGSATLDGGLAVYFSQPTGTAGDSFLLLDTDHEISDRGIQLSAAVNGKIEYLDNGNDLYLTLTSDDLINFAPTGLNRNQTSLAKHLDAVFDTNPTPLEPVLNSLLYATFGLDAYKNALDLLSPEIYVDTQAAALFSSNAFSDNLLSCRVNGQGVSFINKEGDCWWLNTTGRFLTRDKTFEMIGYDETVGTFSAGRQLALGPVWRLSVGMGYQHSTLTTNTNATSDSNQIQGGFALKYNPGSLLLAAAINGGYGWYDTTRPMAFGDFAATAQGDQNVSLFAARLYGSHVFGSPNLFIKPILSGAATRLGLGDVTETGAGSANLRVSGQSETIYSISPALEAGTQGRLGDQTIVRPYVRAGMTWFSQNDVSAAATFVDSPSGVAPFSVVTTLDQTWADVAGGLELITAKNTNMRLYYDGHLAQEFTIHSVGLKLGMSF